MADPTVENLLQRLTGRGTSEQPEAWAAVEAAEPAKPADNKGDDRLEQLLSRINGLGAGQTQPKPTAFVQQPAGAPAAAPEAAIEPNPVAALQAKPDEYIPIEPRTLHEAGITPSQVEALVLKLLLSRGDVSGRQTSDHIKLPFLLLDELLRTMKMDQLVVHRGAAPMNDYIYQLTELGRERARRMVEHCSYYGSAPVSLEAYIASVKAQSLTTQHPTEADLKRAFDDLLINPKMLYRLGPAVNSGRGLFLYGAAGNGKTSIAERVTKAFGSHIWVPRAISVDGEIIRVFDPSNHEELPLEASAGLLDQRKIDRRWVRIRRPTIVVGGELTMDNLEITRNSSTGISEAPLQMKSNCGTLVIDDFGRQRMSTDELLNRWIIPLEKRYDYLNLANGKKIQVPFDQLIIFSTNLQPKDLIDEAFFRRIPYKIEVMDPSENEFRSLLKIMVPKLNILYNEEAATYLIEKHFKGVRPFRCCQPRDLLLQVRNYCLYKSCPLEMTPDLLDFAVENYFAVM